MPRSRRKRLRLEDSRIYRHDGRIFAVTICCQRRRRVFSDRSVAGRCVTRLHHLARDRGNPLYAYCLMPDHVHLVLGVHERSDLSRFVQSWKSACTAIWRELGGGATFWQRSFHDRGVRRRDDLRALCEYVLANPVRAGLVEDWRAYPWSGSLEWDL